MSELGQALGRLGRDPTEKITNETEPLETITKDKLQRLEDESMQGDKARLLAVRAPHAGVWLGVVSSRALDLMMTNEEIKIRAGRRLGASIGEEGPCVFVMHAM